MATMPAGGKVCRALKRLLSIWVLLLGVVLYAPAPERAAFSVPDVVRVRLFSTSQPSEIRVTTAKGQRILIDARQTTSPFRTEDPVTIQTPGGKPVPLQSAQGQRQHSLRNVADLAAQLVEALRPIRQRHNDLDRPLVTDRREYVIDGFAIVFGKTVSVQ